MVHVDIPMHIFLFLIRFCLFTVTGMVLHSTEASSVHRHCPGLWETMAVILVMKCLRLTLCAVAFRLARINGSSHRLRWPDAFDLVMHAFFFITECVFTLRSLNNSEYVAAAGEPFDGHPLIAYVNEWSVVCMGRVLRSFVCSLLHFEPMILKEFTEK